MCFSVLSAGYRLRTDLVKGAANRTFSGDLMPHDAGLLDLPPYTARISLLEGDTPLIPTANLVRELGGGFEL